MDKKLFKNVEMEVIEFKTSDIITDSIQLNGEYSEDIDSWDIFRLF